MILSASPRTDMADVPQPAAASTQAARRNSTAAPGYSPRLGSLTGCVKAAATFYLFMLPGGAEAAMPRQTPGRAPDSRRLQNVTQRFVAHGGRDIMMLEAHGRPDNPLVFTRLGEGALAGTDEDVEIWFEMNVDEGTDTSRYEAHPKSPKQKDQLLDALDYMMPSTREIRPSFSRGLMGLVDSHRASFKVINWASETPDPARFLDSAKTKLVNIGQLHADGISIPPEHSLVSPGWVAVPPLPIPHPRLLQLPPQARANMFNLFDRSTALRKTMMVVTDDALSTSFDLRRITKDRVAEGFVRHYNGRGYPVMQVPVAEGFTALVVLPLEDLATMQELANEDPQIKIVWNAPAGPLPHTDL
jgi:hypothetical protein